MTVARMGSIKNAAEVLALSPSALSRRVQTLENRMGEALFERKHQALSLTIAGERLLEAVAPLIDDLGRIFDSMSGPHELRLRVGVLPLFASHVLMPQLPRLRNLHPELHLDLDTAPLPVSRLGEGLDVALTLAQDIDPRFYSRRIGHNRIAVVASKAMANSSNAPRTPDDLRGHTFLVHRDMPNAVNHWFEAQGLPVIRPVETIQFDSGQLILDAAATDMGIAFMLDTLLANDPRLQPIFDVKIDSPYEYWFVCKQAALSSKTVRMFHNWLFDEIDLSNPAPPATQAASRAF